MLYIWGETVFWGACTNEPLYIFPVNGTLYHHLSPVQSSDALCPKAHQLSFLVTVYMVCLLLSFCFQTFSFLMSRFVSRKQHVIGFYFYPLTIYVF